MLAFPKMCEERGAKIRIRSVKYQFDTKYPSKALFTEVDWKCKNLASLLFERSLLGNPWKGVF